MAFTFNGENILGDDYSTVVHAGTALARAESFTLPGVRGEFEHRMGTAGAPIVVQAVVRAASYAAMKAIREGLNKYAAAAGTYTLVDQSGEIYANCTLRTATPLTRRQLMADQTRVRQEWYLEFRQLDPTIGT